jgi:hypothetical protein
VQELFAPVVALRRFGQDLDDYLGVKQGVLFLIVEFGFPANDEKIGIGIKASAVDFHTLIG